MITVELMSDAGRTVYFYQSRDINGDIISSGAESHSIGFIEEYAPAGMTGLEYYTAYNDARAYEQISRDVLQSMIDAQAAEIARIMAAGVSPFHIACHRSQFPALRALEKAIITYSASMRIN